MKYCKRGEHRLSFEVSVVADERKILKELDITKPNDRVMQCYLPVEDGQHLTFVCEATNCLKDSVIDLVVDGILRDSYAFRPKLTKVVKFEFDSGHYTININTKQASIRKGKLTISSEQQEQSYSEGPPRVGTVEVRFHRALSGGTADKLSQYSTIDEANHYGDLAIPWNSFGVTPDCYIMFAGEELLTQSQRRTFRKNMNKPRPSQTPWMTMRYVYRTAATLKGMKSTSLNTAQAQGYINSELPVANSAFGFVANKGNDFHEEAEPASLEHYSAGRVTPCDSSLGKRKRDETINLAELRLLREVSSAPSRMAKREMDKLESEVQSLRYGAAMARKRAAEARDRLTKRIEAETRDERVFEELMEERKRAIAEIETFNRQEEIYQVLSSRGEAVELKSGREGLQVSRIMLLNQDVALSTPSVLLVPYEPHHVPEYHEWMQRPELQELTASEPLSVEEEYGMQASWRNDTDKLTFIVCLPFAGRPETVHAGADDGPDQMIGDINLFLSDNPEAQVAVAGQAEELHHVVGEVEIMIAKPGATGQGRGRAALLAFLRYVHDHQAELCRAFAAGKGLREVARAPERLDYLRVKIGQGNTKSIGLFQSLGFTGDGQASVFGEIELRLQPELSEALNAWDRKWQGSVSSVVEIMYERDITVEIEEGSDEEMQD